MRAAILAAAATLLIACSGGKSDDGSAVGTTAVADSRSSLVQGKVAGVPEVSAGIAGPPERRELNTAQVAPQEGTASDAANQAIKQSASSVDLGTSTSGQVIPSMVIRNGQASVEVEKLDPAIVKLRQLATQLGGYVANSSMIGGRDQVPSAMLELKIPAQRFDQAINGLSTLGKVESVNATAEDVGEEFVDVTARVNNAKRLEERLIELLANRTGRLQDVLSVERELARVREEIERYEGRLRYLKTRVAISTLMVTLHEPLPILGQSPGQNPIAEAIRRAWRNFVGFIASGIAALGVLIPLAALALVGWLAYKRFRRRG
jgi:uncharacterized protein DUF4349